MIPNLSEIVEGTTKLLVPVEEKLLKKNPVFYNPEMEFSRDLSVAVVRVLKPEKFCDLLSGSGARGVRIANETGTGEVVANDVNPSAYELIKKNISLNNIPDFRVRAVNDYAQNVLSRETFDFIDVDPFGPPIQFMDCALRSIKNNGTLAVTATDTAALCGTYPKACRRKYDSLSLRAEYFNESGLRILIGFVARNALKYNIGIMPLFSHCTHHYFRAYLKVQMGNKYVNENLRNIRYIQHCFSCLNRSYRSLDALEEKCVCGERLATAGPVWAGNFSDTEFCENLNREIEAGVFNTKKKALKIIPQVSEEQEIQIPYYDLHRICKKLNITAPAMNELFRKFRENNFKITRTHFSGTGIRTDAKIPDIIKMVRNY